MTHDDRERFFDATVTRDDDDEVLSTSRECADGKPNGHLCAWLSRRECANQHAPAAARPG